MKGAFVTRRMTRVESNREQMRRTCLALYLEGMESIQFKMRLYIIEIHMIYTLGIVKESRSHITSIEAEHVV